MILTSFKRYLERPALFFLFVLLSVALAFWLCLSFIFPKFFNPLEPANRDVIDHFQIGALPWATIFNVALRPTAWAAMKLVHPFGLSGLSLLVISAVLIAICLIVVVFKERASIEANTMLIALPLYLFALFSHPEFYIKHRDDIELAIAFLLFSIALYFWHRWTKTREQWCLVIFCFSAALEPLAKETFFIAMPIMFLGLALIEKKISYRLAPAIYAFVVTVGGLLFLRSRNSFLHNSLSVYQQDFTLTSVASLLIKYLEVAFTVPTLLLCAISIAVSIPNGKRLIVVLTFLIAGTSSYLPNSLLPNHWIEWYGWDGLPFLLAPLLASIPEQRDKWIWLAPTACLLLVATIFVYTTRYDGFPTRLVQEEVIDQHVLDSFPALRKASDHAIFLVRGIADFQFLPWQTAGFSQNAIGDGMRFELEVPSDIIGPIRKAGGVPFENAILSLADNDFVKAHPPNFVAKYAADGRLLAIDAFHNSDFSRSAINRRYSRGEFAIASGGATPPILTWNVPEASSVEVHVNTPDGPLMTGGGSAGQAQTGTWVTPKMRFYLVDVTLKDPKASPVIISSLSLPGQLDGSPTNANFNASKPSISNADQQPAMAMTFRADNLSDVKDNGLGITTLHWQTNLPEIQIHVDSPSGPLFVDQGGKGDAITGLWARNGMTFYLEKPLDSQKSKWIVVATTSTHLVR